MAQECIQKRAVRYDKDGDNHYDTISAFIKSMRGSDPDAAVYYLARMLYAGEDIKFIARRIMICASEDVGNADPQALTVAVSAAQAVERIGMPEAQIILSQAVLYVATAPKSNSACNAVFEAMDAVKKSAFHAGSGASAGFPLRRFRENWDTESDINMPMITRNHYVEQQYLPDGMEGQTFYHPSENGYESKIVEHMRLLGNRQRMTGNPGKINLFFFFREFYYNKIMRGAADCSSRIVQKLINQMAEAISIIIIPPT